MGTRILCGQATRMPLSHLFDEAAQRMGVQAGLLSLLPNTHSPPHPSPPVPSSFPARAPGAGPPGTGCDPSVPREPRCAAPFTSRRWPSAIPPPQPYFRATFTVFLTSLLARLPIRPFGRHRTGVRTCLWIGGVFPFPPFAGWASKGGFSPVIFTGGIQFIFCDRFGVLVCR